MLDAWDKELVSSGQRVDAHRRAYLTRLTPQFERLGRQLTGSEVELKYSPGWAEQQDLGAVLRASREEDRSLGYTRSGPHRADIVVGIESERSRWRASQGQLKLLGSALVVSQCHVTGAADQSMVLLIDEPAADLDSERLREFMGALSATQAQLFIAAIDAESLGFPSEFRLFHVEHGIAKALL